MRDRADLVEMLNLAWDNSPLLMMAITEELHECDGDLEPSRWRWMVRQIAYAAWPDMADEPLPANAYDA